MTSIKTKSIDEITETLIDYRGKTPEKSNHGIRLITAKVIKGGFITDDKPEYIAEANYKKWMTRGFPKQWDILITTEAPLGEVAMLRSTEKVALAQRVILLRGNPSIINQKYYFYCLQSPFVQGNINARATGTTVLGIKQSELRQVQIPLPPLPIQRRISSILSAYDDLIENNTRRIAILEEMARRIYEEWFVHFRFPGHEKVKMVDSELGKIPEGWEICSLLQIAEVNARTLRRGSEPKEITYIDISSVSTSSINKKQLMLFSDAPGRARRIVRDGDIIWSCVRPNRKSYALILQPESNLIVSTGFSVLSATKVPFSYLYFTTTTEDFVAYLTNHATGAAYPAVTARDFEAAKLLKPSISLLNNFHRSIEPMLRLGKLFREKNTNLRTTRDFLLPKLISGEIDVSKLPEPEDAAA